MTRRRPWFSSCAPVDIRKGSYDALEFLEGREADLDWRLCSVPVSDLPVRLSGSYEGESAAETEQRMEAIRDWMQQQGGAEAALCQRPILALAKRSGKPRVIDGYHRIGTAVRFFGVQQIPTLVGFPRLRRKLGR
jgi:hypothetical protein